MTVPYTDHRLAAQAILYAALRGTSALRPREGQFLGGIAFDANPPTQKQLDWLLILLDRHGLPTLQWEASK
jgi:hypothetical protein